MAPKRKSANAAAKSAAAAPAVDWSKKTVAQLKAECKKQGLDCDGKKAELVERLQENGDGPSPPKMQKQNTLTKALDEIKKSAAADKKNKNKKHTIDKLFPMHGGVVYEDYDCMLNQTNIGHNNNKFYIIQVIEDAGTYYVWNRWGRVGENGANSMRQYDEVDDAIKDFEKKFQDKTKNQWQNRNKFKPVAGKYTMLDMGDDEEEEVAKMTVTTKPTNGVPSATKSCSLDPITAALVKLLFDHDMFKEALVNMEIDIKKMPLGKLSKSQILKGFEVLDKIQDVLDKKKKGNMTELSSEFYTHIPHDFGRQRPTVINTPELLRKKLDMLITLGDIELAQDMLKKEDQLVKTDESDLPLHPLDSHYELLRCNMTLLKAGDKEFQVIEKYFEATKPSYGAKKIINVWRVDRENEGQRFKEFDPIGHRKLLWHGTNVAVVAAILKSGLRIMPHSGGRVGRGIYFASENAKSAGYVQCARQIGIMFLNEVALGKEKTITMDDSSLTKPPQGFDSIVARGQQEPDSKNDVKIEIDGRHVIVPQGKPIPSEFKSSSFHQSEYLVYKESQCRIRYLLQIQFQ